MLDHIVLLKFKEDTTEEAIKDLENGLLNLHKDIPEIISLTTGENFSDRGQGFQRGLVVRLKNKADLEVYSKHPSHQELVTTKIKPAISDIIAIDYEY